MIFSASYTRYTKLRQALIEARRTDERSSEPHMTVEWLYLYPQYSESLGNCVELIVSQGSLGYKMGKVMPSLWLLLTYATML